MNDLSIDPPYRPMWITRVVTKLQDLNRRAKVTNEAAKWAVNLLDSIEIDFGLSDPEILISPRGLVVFRWANGAQSLDVLVKQPSVTGRMRAFVRQVVKSEDLVACTSWHGGHILVRDQLVAMFGLGLRWSMGQES